MTLEHPDLGAFTTVFRALNNLQTPRAFAIPGALKHNHDQLSEGLSDAHLSELESDAPSGAPEDDDTVWTHRPIASYLNPGDETDSALARSNSRSGSDTEGELELIDGDGQEVEIEDLSDIDEADQPSLGYLDEALSFIAAEREKFHLQREAGTTNGKSNGSGVDNAWRHVVDPRRKRRRKRKVMPISRDATTTGGDGGSVPVDPTKEQDMDDDSSSSFDHESPQYFKSTPATPPRTKSEKQQHHSILAPDGPHAGHPKLSHSRSTPSLRLSLTMPPDPRILQLRSLAHKLRLLFPENAPELTTILSNEFTESAASANFVDPRGPNPQSQDTLIHIFIDQCVLFLSTPPFLR